MAKTTSPELAAFLKKESEGFENPQDALDTFRKEHWKALKSYYPEFTTELAKRVSASGLSDEEYDDLISDLLGEERDERPFRNRYWFVVDLDERGQFNVHVEDPSGQVVWQASNEDEEDGEFGPVRDGFMKHGQDIAGLESYLKDLEIIPQEASLGDEKERGQLDADKQRRQRPINKGEPWERNEPTQWKFNQGKMGESVKGFVDSLLEG